jgi:signal transduction histidine kinase
VSSRFRRRDGPVELSVARHDGGVGIRVDSVGSDDHQGGLGIIGMSERMQLCGGTFTAGRSEHGWQVRAWLPAS